MINLRDIGAGIPGGGLFTPDQSQRSSSAPVAGQLPKRGTIGVRDTGADAFGVARGEQVKRASRFSFRLGVVAGLGCHRCHVHQHAGPADT